jgi:hypothetical protein
MLYHYKRYRPHRYRSTPDAVITIGGTTFHGVIIVDV